MRRSGGLVVRCAWRTALAAVLALAGVTSGTAGAAAETYPITQASVRVLYLAPIFAAMDRGFFKEHSVDFTYREISAGTLASAAVISGDAQVSNYDILVLAQLKAEGGDPLIFYNLVDRVTLDLVVRNDAIAKSGVKLDAAPLDRMKSLNSLTYGITGPGAPSDVFARYFLIKAGFDPDRDATLVQIGNPAALAAAFRSGRIDAFFLSPPLSSTFEQEGIGKVVIHNSAGEIPELTQTSYSALFTSKHYAETHGEALKAYVAAVRDGVKWVTDNRDAAAALLHEKWFTDTPQATLRVGLDTLIPSISATGVLSREALERYLAIFAAVGEHSTADLTEGVLWTNEFVK